MCVVIPTVLVFSLIILVSMAQLTNIVGLTSVSVSPTDATCGRTSADSYCRVDLAADAVCVVHTCRTVCEDTGPTHLDLLDISNLSGFSYDGSVTKTTKDLGSGYVTVAVFNKSTPLAFLRGEINVEGEEEFTVTFRMKPDNMANESSVIDLHGSSYGQRMLNVRLSTDLGLTVASGTNSVTRQTWTIPRHAWTHVAVQLRQNDVTVFLNGSDVTGTIAPLQLYRGSYWSKLKLKIGQAFAGDLEQTHLVSEGSQVDREFCNGRSDGWVDYTVASVRIQCVDGDVSTIQDNRHPSTCHILSLELPPPYAELCRDKVDGWYRQQIGGYTQCLDGRQLNEHTCGRTVNETGPGLWYYQQCQFCSTSCSCELDCPTSNAEERCDALGFVCRDGEQKVHPKYCDQYYFCVRGKYERRKCVYPDRWSIEHGQCERFQSVSCGERIPQNHPCDDDRGMPILKHGCDPGKNPGNCTGQKDGLYYKVYGGMCSLYGCFNGTLTTLEGDLPSLYIPGEHQATLYVCRVSSGGIDPATGLCKKGADCPEDTAAFVPDSPYLRCTIDKVLPYRYDGRKYWRCQNGMWTVEICPEGLIWSSVKKQCWHSVNCGSYYCPKTVDTKERQFLGELADIRLYEDVLSRNDINKLLSCNVWASDAHPIDYALDSDSSTFWLSRPDVDTVDILVDLQGMQKLEEVSMTFFGPVPRVVSIFKKVTADDSWHLWRVFRDDCNDILKCAKLGSVLKLDGERLTYNLLEASLGPLQRRASSLRVRLSGHRHEGAAQLRNISYFGLYTIAIYRRDFDTCGLFGYVAQESSTSCLPCSCDDRGVIDGNGECNEVGGQCACKRYVTGRFCDRCLSGYYNIQQNNTYGCASLANIMTSSVQPTPSEQQMSSTISNLKTGPLTHKTESSTPWVLYLTPACVFVVVATIIIIAVISVRRRRQRDSGQGTDNPATELEPTYEPMPVAPSEEVPYDDAMTKRGSSKVQMRLPGQSRETVTDSGYLEPYSVVGSGPDYQRPVPAVPVKTTPQFAELTRRQSDQNTDSADPDYMDIR